VTPRVPSVMFCIAQLALVKLSMRALGFGRTLAYCERSVRPSAYPHSADEPMIGRVARKVAAAAVLYPGRARCLEQSLVLSRELRRCGADADVRFGIHPYPFSAHAWVEVQGRPINEDRDYLNMFTPLEG
jgi:hypothetical protein